MEKSAFRFGSFDSVSRLFNLPLGGYDKLTNVPLSNEYYIDVVYAYETHTILVL